MLDDQALARLGELDQSGKAGLVARVIGTYVKSLDRLLNQWLGARSAADHAGMRHVAHTLKSSSASVGALTLSGLCAEVEARLRDGPLEGLEPRLDALTDEATHILAALRADSPS